MAEVSIASVKGADKILANIELLKSKMGKGAQKGVTLAALWLQRASQRLTPVDTGVLRASAFTRVTGAGLNTKARVGYTANYALFVHELVEMKLKGQPRRAPHHGMYWDPQGQAQAKFLEAPMNSERPKMLDLIRNAIIGEDLKVT